MTIRHGDLVKVKGSRRFWVCLRVSQTDIHRGLNAKTPGLYLFSGYWYRQEIGGPLNHRAYGKIDEVRGRKVGRVCSHYAALKTNR